MSHKNDTALPHLRYWRRYQHISQRKLAHQAGIATSTIARLETGRTTAIAATIEKLQTALHISHQELLNEPPIKPTSTV